MSLGPYLMPITAQNILDSDGQYPERAAKATEEHRRNAIGTAFCVNGLLQELGYKDGQERPKINDGFRDDSVTYGAKFSAHKEGKAVDLADPGQILSNLVTRTLLRNHGLRREDNSYTATWCHLDTRGPAGSIFQP